MTIYSLSGLLAAITSGLMVALMLFISKKKLHYLWAVFCLSVFLFGVGIYFVGGSITPDAAVFWWRIAHVGAILIPVLFLHFVHEFLGIKQTAVLVAIYGVSFLLLIANFTDGLFIDNMRFVFDEFYYDSPPGTFYPLFTSIFFGLIAYSHFLLWKGLKESNDKFVRGKIKLFFLGTAVGFAGGAFNFLPVYGIDIYPYMNMTVFLYPLIITYAIIKHQLFDIKLILVELAVLSLNLFLFVNIFTSNAKIDLTLNIAVFASVLVFSISLVRGIYKDIRDRERIEELIKEAEEANARLRQMETQKTEFVSIASHQLRTPLTIVKGYTSMLLEGTFGHISDTARSTLEKLYASSVKLVALVEDLLTVSRIEQGRVTLNFEVINLKDFVQDVLKEAKAMANESQIDLSFNIEENKEVFAAVDEKKFKQVVRHILENAIKYTPAHGSVNVFVMDDSLTGKARLIISDTGAGMASSQINAFLGKPNTKRGADGKQIGDAEQEEVFDKGFENSAPGLGFYIARGIIEAHHGTLYVESAGVNYGVTVVVEIPKSHQ